jgi:hypothetical protein
MADPRCWPAFVPWSSFWPRDEDQEQESTVCKASVVWAAACALALCFAAERTDESAAFAAGELACLHSQRPWDW